MRPFQHLSFATRQGRQSIFCEFAFALKGTFAHRRHDRFLGRAHVCCAIIVHIRARVKAATDATRTGITAQHMRGDVQSICTESCIEYWSAWNTLISMLTTTGPRHTHTQTRTLLRENTQRRFCTPSTTWRIYACWVSFARARLTSTFYVLFGCLGFTFRSYPQSALCQRVSV